MDMSDGDCPKLGDLFGGSYQKGYSILGSILGSPHLWKPPPTCIDITNLTEHSCEKCPPAKGLGLGFRAA